MLKKILFIVFLLLLANAMVTENNFEAPLVNKSSVPTVTFSKEKILNVNANSSKLVKLDFVIKNLAVGNPEIADVIIVSKQEILVNAKKPGITTLTLWDAYRSYDYKIVVDKSSDNLTFKVYKLTNVSLTKTNLDDPDKMMVVSLETQKETVDDLKNILSTYLEPTQFSVSPWLNSILVVGSPEDHKKIEEVVKIVDSRDKQILFEVEVYELKKNNGIKHELQLLYGKDYSISEPDEVLNDVTAKYNKAEDGLNYTFNTKSYTAAGALAEYTTHILKLLESEGNARILAKPKILTLNNRHSFIHAGEKTPIIKTDKQGNQSVDYLYTGVILGVIPKVNEEGEINCWLSTQVSSISGYNTTNGYPIVGTRETVNEVRLKDNATLVIGGLLKETETKTYNKIPILGDLLGWIPYIGSFVKNEVVEKNNTELVITLKPKIVFDQEILTAENK